MSNRNDFDFDDDDFRFDDDDDFNLSDDDLPPGLDDDDDLPDLDEDDERGTGPNRTFIVIATLMILLFLGGLGAILFLATRDTGPTEAELTTTAVLLTNEAVGIALAQTQTQSVEFANLTLTAGAATDTPTPTETPTREPTVTPTPTLDATDLAGTQLAEQANAAGTAAALATLAARAGEEAANASLDQLFSTEVAYQTQQAAFVQSSYATTVALATLGVVPEAVRTQVVEQQSATRVALGSQADFAAIASGLIEAQFATRLPQGGMFSTLVAQGTPAAALTQSALATPQAQATVGAVSTLEYFQTRVAEAQSDAGAQFAGVESGQVSGPAATTEAALRNQLDAQIALIQQAAAGAPGNAEVEALGNLVQTPVALATLQSDINRAVVSTQTSLIDGGLSADAAQTQVANESLATQAALQEQIAAAEQALEEISAVLAAQAANNSALATAIANLTMVPAMETSYDAPFDLLAVFGPIGRAQAAPVEQAEPTVTPTPTPPPPTQETLPTADPGFAATLVAGATQSALQDRAALIADTILGAETAAPDTAGVVATALSDSFATQAAYATNEAGQAAIISATQTAVAEATGDIEALGTQVAVDYAATLTARIAELEAALATYESVLATSVAQNNALATQVAQATPAAQATQDALATSIAGQPFVTREVIVVLPTEDNGAIETLAAVQTQVAEIGDLSGLEAFATQSALMTPQALATTSAISTQAALAARAELIRQALILELAQNQPTQEVIDANSVALTATSLALTLAPQPTQESLATATQAFVALPTALPDTGLFDDVVAGGRDGVGLLALMAFGLVGVIAISRRLRSSNNKK
jgi:hypothetical protein